MKKILAVLLAVSMLFAFAACGGDKSATDAQKEELKQEVQDELDTIVSDLTYIKDKGTMIVGITEYKPMNFKDENQEWTGFDTEFALLVGEKLGVKVEFFEIADWDNKFIDLDTKTIDCVWNGMTINDGALKNSSVSNPYVKNAQVVVMKEDKLADYATVESMKGLNFAVEQGSAGKDAAVANGLNYTEVKYQSDALLEVQSGTSDACIIDITMANSMTGEGTSYEGLGYAVELNAEEYGISFRKDSDVTAEVNKIMAELMADGTLDALAEKYGLTLIK